MMNHCKNCCNASEAVAELLRIYESDDVPRMMTILTETIATDKNLHHADRKVLAEIIHLINALMKEKIADQQAEILLLKKTA